MDREVPIVPITTLAGVASLTDLLPEMPLPTPSPQSLGNKSLLFHPRVAEEAQNLLGVQDEVLIPQLIQSLVQTSAEHIDVKENFSNSDISRDQHEGMPLLLKAMLNSNPALFSGVPVSQQNHLTNFSDASKDQAAALKQKQLQGLQQHIDQQRQNLISQHKISIQQKQQLVNQQQQSALSPVTVKNSSTKIIPLVPEIHEMSSILQNQQQDSILQKQISSLPQTSTVVQEKQPLSPSATTKVPGSTSTHRPSVITELKTSPTLSSSLNCQDSLSANIQHSVNNLNERLDDMNAFMKEPQVNVTEQLRQLRRPPKGASGVSSSSSPQQGMDSFLDVSTTSNSSSGSKSSRTTRAKSKSDLGQECDTPKSDQGTLSKVSTNGTVTLKTCDPNKNNEILPNCARYPVVKLAKLSNEDQEQILQNLTKFVEEKPELARDLGIVPESNKESQKVKDNNGSDSDNDNLPLRKKGKRKIESDDEYNVTDTFSALVGSNKKRRKESEIDESNATATTTLVSKPKLRRVERKFVPVLEKLSQEELMETNTFLRFNKSIEHVLKSAEDIDVNEINDDGIIQDEYLLSRIVIQDLCTEAAKLKILGAMESIPTDRLVRLLNVLEINIRGGDRVSPITDEDNESLRQYWLETTMERVMGATDACLVCLYIMTSPNMPKRVYIEEVIDRVVLFIKYHLHNTIFPSFDSTYRLDNKKKDGRRKKTSVSEKGILNLYTKISELVGLLAELLNIQVLTDTSVLHASSMGVSPFFAENVNALQLACLKLVTTIFTRYESHRRLLLDDILASIARLPSTKRSLRTYRLNSEEHIQMLTALVLQLIQCVVALPDHLIADSRDTAEQTKESINKSEVDKDILISNNFEKARSIAGTFLTVFLNKCGSKNEDIDYRPLFENFVQDLLSTVNKPEWPATGILLNLLGVMLVNNFTNKSTDMSLRVVSLDYLGVVAARLRKDSVLSRHKLNTIDQMIKDIKSEESKVQDETIKKKKYADDEDEERTIFLQKVLLDFLSVKAQSDESYKYARHFYISRWYKDVINEKMHLASGKPVRKNNVHQSKRRIDSDDDDVSEYNQSESVNQENAEKFQILEERKKFLTSKIKPFQEAISSGNRVQIYQTYIDYNSAELITQYLGSKQLFCQSFDKYLKSILIVLKETSIAIRTKAMKCLTMIVEADPSVLGRHDMQMGVNHSFLDHSTSVREAAVDLVGKFVLSRPELIDKYYEMLSARILDTGVSVRKRVIKILKDICIECPDFPKIPEICVKMIRRVNDEEGIRKLVMEVFQNMWFTPTTKDMSLLRKVMNITDVVASSKDIGLEWFEQLLVSLFKPKEDKDDSTKVQSEPPKALLLACSQIVDCLIENVLRLDETNDNTTSASKRLVACLTTLHLFAKIRPQLLVKHASTLQPYLGVKCQSAGDIEIITSVARMLEMVVPLMEHPSESFLAQLEEDSIKLVLKQTRPIVSSCLSCLGSIINKVTRNFKLIRDIFKNYYRMLLTYRHQLELNCEKSLNDMKARPTIRRSLFIVGMLLRHFNFKDPAVIGDLEPDITDRVYQLMTYYLNLNDPDIQNNTLKAIGCICIRHYEFMLQDDLKMFYHNVLVQQDATSILKREVLLNIENYLVEDENRMVQQNLDWNKRSKQENLKEMGDVSAGMASAIIQTYLKEVLQSYLHADANVRTASLKVIQMVFQQGLVHPVLIIPYLICTSTDTEKVISHSADKLLQDIESRYPGFTHTKASFGMILSFQLQKILQADKVIRGCKVKEVGEYPSALNGFLYSLLRNIRQQRRALILNILKQFDEHTRTTLSYMMYLADNLAYFPYQVQDEPLFIVHHIDIMISVSGTNLLQSFREGLIVTEPQKIAALQQTTENGEIVSNTVSALDEDDDDEDVLVNRMPEDTLHLQSCMTAAQGCLLLLMLKQHIKDIYGLSDSKIQQYSPAEAAKIYEKNITRRNNSLFNPKTTLQKLKQGDLPQYLDETGRRNLIRQYLDFKQLMLQLDPDDPDDEENKGVQNISNSHVGIGSTAHTSVLTPSDQKALENFKDTSSTTPKVPKLVISNRRLDSETKRSRTQRVSEKTKKHRNKKKRRKFANSSGDDSDYSDPDFLA